MPRRAQMLTKAILASLLLAAVLPALAGCNATGTPSFEYTDKPGDIRRNPTVDDVMDHVACELQSALYARQPVLFSKKPPAYRARAEMAAVPNSDRRQRLYSEIEGSEAAIRQYGYGDHAHTQVTPTREEALWNNLIRDNFVATISLSIQVTNSEGINPNLSFITPSPPMPIPGGTFNSGSLSVAVAGQFDGTQDRIFTVNYLIDIAKLWDADIQNCDSIPGGKGPTVDRSLGIRGDLRLSEIFDSGLEALDRAKAYNIYAVPTDEQAAPIPAAGAAAGRKSVMATVTGAPAAAPAQGAKTGPNTSSADSSFHAQVDFTVNLGASGGPTWVMRHFTGPGGGGGGGGGGGKGGGGGGGGGGSQGFLSANRTAINTLVMQIGATCYKDPAATPNPDPSNYWEAVNPCSGDNGAQRVGAIRDQMNLNVLSNKLSVLQTQP